MLATLSIGCGSQKITPFSETEVNGLSISNGDTQNGSRYHFQSATVDGKKLNTAMVTIYTNGMAVGPIVYWDLSSDGVIQMRQMVDGPIVNRMEMVSDGSGTITIRVNGVDSVFTVDKK